MTFLFDFSVLSGPLYASVPLFFFFLLLSVPEHSNQVPKDRYKMLNQVIQDLKVALQYNLWLLPSQSKNHECEWLKFRNHCTQAQISEAIKIWCQNLMSLLKTQPKTRDHGTYLIATFFKGISFPHYWFDIEDLPYFVWLFPGLQSRTGICCFTVLHFTALDIVDFYKFKVCGNLLWASPFFQ